MLGQLTALPAGRLQATLNRDDVKDLWDKASHYKQKHLTHAEVAMKELKKGIRHKKSLATWMVAMVQQKPEAEEAAPNEEAPVGDTPQDSLLLEEDPDEEEDDEVQRMQTPEERFQQCDAMDWAAPSAMAACDREPPPDITNPRIWWRHPWARLAAVWSIIFLDFYIYGEDPVQDSQVNYPYFGVFEDMFIVKWPDSTFFRVTRIVLTVLISMFGMWFGRQVIHHRFLRDWCGFRMFTDNNGTLVVMFLSWVVFFEYVLPYPVNLIESGTISVPITEASVLPYATWGKIWQSTACIADMFTIFMISDAVLQDRTVWPSWGKRVKWLWNDALGGWVRVLAFWVTFIVFVPFVIWQLSQTGHSNPLYVGELRLTHDAATTQWARVAITALLTMVDISTCIQDWEFPTYSAPVDFKVTGTFLSELRCSCLSNVLSKFLPSNFADFFQFHMSGKWLAYLPAFGALGVDWWYMCRTIFGYVPENLGQYERPSDCAIFVITDEAVLKEAYEDGKLLPEKRHLISWAARGNLTGDSFIHSKFCDDPPWLKLVPLIVGILAGVGFIVLIIRAEYYWDHFSTRNNGKEFLARLEEYREQAQEELEEDDGNSKRDAEAQE